MAAHIEREGGIVPVPGTGSVAKVRWGTLLAASVGAGIAHLGTSTMPFQVGALMDASGMTASAAGIFAFCQIGALALTMLIVSPLIHRSSPAVVAAAGAIVGSCAHLLLFLSVASVPVMLFAAVVAGAGYGLIFAAMISGTAAYSGADRIYAIANGGALVVIVALMALLPQASLRFGPLGPFLGIAILIALTAPAYLGFRGGPRAPVATGGKLIHLGGVLPLLALWTAFSLGTGAVWSFVERIGHSLSLDPQTIGVVLSASTFCGIAGTAVAAAFANRLSRMVALLTGFVGTGFACLLLGFSWGLIPYAVGVLCYWVFYMFLYSYLLGSAAAIDPSGRVGTAGGGCERLGFALGAPLGGVLIDHFSYSAVGIVGAIGCVGLLPFCLAPLRAAFGGKTPAPHPHIP